MPWPRQARTSTPECHPTPTDPNCVETALHWAASSNDVVAIDALLDLGADIEATGAMFTGGAPLSDAVVFANWEAARRLVARGARPTWWQGAALGMLDVVTARWDDNPWPTHDEVIAGLLARLPRRPSDDGRLFTGARPDPQWVGWIKDAARRLPRGVATRGSCRGFGAVCDPLGVGDLTPFARTSPLLTPW